MARILLVEDKADVAHVIGEALLHAGHDVLPMGNAALAIEAIDQGQTFDLIITDIIMPVKDGYDLIAFLEKSKIETPVIVMSGGGLTLSKESAIMSLKSNVDGVLEKPMSQEKMLTMVNQLTQGSTHHLL